MRFFTAIFLLLLSMWPASLVAEAPRTVSVAIYDNSDGSAHGPKNLIRILSPDEGFTTKRVTPAEIRAGALRGCDAVILPGGSGSKQSESLGASGREEVQRFVREGGGFVGICAGSYLASAEYPWSLHLINTRVIDRKHWARGKGDVTLSLSQTGREVLGESAREVVVNYNQGPLMAPAVEEGLPPYTPLALFETEVAKKGAPEGVMRGLTAIAAGRYGEGRVLCISPHPERLGGPNHLVLNGVKWATCVSETTLTGQRSPSADGAAESHPVSIRP